MTPPPTAKSAPPRSILCSARKSSTRPRPASDLLPSPGSTISTGVSPNIARKAALCAWAKFVSVNTATPRPAVARCVTAWRTSEPKSAAMWIA